MRFAGAFGYVPGGAQTRHVSSMSTSGACSSSVACASLTCAGRFERPWLHRPTASPWQPQATEACALAQFLDGFQQKKSTSWALIMGYVITCAVKNPVGLARGRPPLGRLNGGRGASPSIARRGNCLAEPECGAPKKRGAGRAKSWAKRERRAAFRAATGMVDARWRNVTRVCTGPDPD